MKMTPAETRLCFAAEEERYRRALHVAYMGAYWNRVKKLEPFESYFKTSAGSMTDEEMLESVKSMNSLFGGE